MLHMMTLRMGYPGRDVEEAFGYRSGAQERGLS